ncbi:MAG TPA: DUF4389 domain-containing protein [Bacteroidales bacterium]|nr:DUF4389 domain-containing protein [Bacteroidales bacterium]
MKLKVQHQEKYSRSELLLRTLFGFFYIALPHLFLLFFVGIWGSILGFIAFWMILFTGKYPQSMFEFQVGYLRWYLRVNARIANVADGYPAFGIKGTDDKTLFEVEYPERISRGLVLVRLFFGAFFVYLPHFFVLFFRGLWVAILEFLAWWIVLFTGTYPLTFHEWVVGQLRWTTRVSLYMGYMTDKYPPFTGDELPDEV